MCAIPHVEHLRDYLSWVASLRDSTQWDTVMNINIVSLFSACPTYHMIIDYECESKANERQRCSSDEWSRRMRNMVETCAARVSTEYGRMLIGALQRLGGTRGPQGLSRQR